MCAKLVYCATKTKTVAFLKGAAAAAATKSSNNFKSNTRTKTGTTATTTSIAAQKKNSKQIYCQFAAHFV